MRVTLKPSMAAWLRGQHVWAGDNAERPGEVTRGGASGFGRKSERVAGSSRQESPRAGGEESFEVFADAVNSGSRRTRENLAAVRM